MVTKRWKKRNHIAPTLLNVVTLDGAVLLLVAFLTSVSFAWFALF